MSEKIEKIYHDNDWSANCSTLFNVMAVLFAIAGIIADKLFGIEKFNVPAMLLVWISSIFPLFLISAIKNHFVNQEALIKMLAELNDVEYRSTDKILYIKKNLSDN